MQTQPAVVQPLQPSPDAYLDKFMFHKIQEAFVAEAIRPFIAKRHGINLDDVKYTLSSPLLSLDFDITFMDTRRRRVLLHAEVKERNSAQTHVQLRDTDIRSIVGKGLWLVFRLSDSYLVGSPEAVIQLSEGKPRDDGFHVIPLDHLRGIGFSEILRRSISDFSGLILP